MILGAGAANIIDENLSSLKILHEPQNYVCSIIPLNSLLKCRRKIHTLKIHRSGETMKVNYLSIENES